MMNPPITLPVAWDEEMTSLRDSTGRNIIGATTAFGRPFILCHVDVKKYIVDAVNSYAPVTEDNGKKRVDVFELTKQRDLLIQAIHKCRNQFQFYADEHSKVGKMAKAATNREFVAICTKALKHTGGL